MRDTQQTVDDSTVGQRLGNSSVDLRVNASAEAARSGLMALCAIARFHQVAADPRTLAHQLGGAPSDDVDASTLLRAAKHLGLKAKLSKFKPDRLKLVPLPALAFLQPTDEATNSISGGGKQVARIVILAEMCSTLYEREVQTDLKRQQATPEKIKALQSENLTTLKAHVAGVVQQLAIHTTGGVTEAQTLMIIAPEGAQVTAEVTLKNKDIGFFNVGNGAEIKLETSLHPLRHHAGQRRPRGGRRSERRKARRDLPGHWP